VGVFLSLVRPQINTWIDGELYIPAHWFEPDQAEKRKAVGVPDDLTFKKKPELGWQMVQRLQAREIPFEALVMDDLYGRNAGLRQRLHAAGIEYYGDIPKDTQVYLDKPKITYPLTKRRKPSKNAQIEGQPAQVKALRAHLHWQTLRLRPNERGYLQADFGRCRV
jgi:SRSO17 transposase